MSTQRRAAGGGYEERQAAMGMTEQQFASYLNQLIGRLEDAREIEDPARREEKIAQIIEDMKKDRDSNM